MPLAGEALILESDVRISVSLLVVQSRHRDVVERYY
jgi:hypothetical protein